MEQQQKTNENQEQQNQPEEVAPQIPEFQLPDIFSSSHIDNINNSKDPIQLTCTLLESNYRKVYKKADFEASNLMAQAEYYVNVLVFLKESFPSFEAPIITKLLNIFAVLIDMSNESESENDFLSLSKKKINDFKTCLQVAKLIPKKKSEGILANTPDKKITPDGRFFLNAKEINLLLSYIKTDYLPYIRMWYYFGKDNREITQQKVEVIINKPMVSLPLTEAVMEVVEQTPQETEGAAEDKMQTEEHKEQEEGKENEGEEEKKEEEPETYLDILNRLGLNAETKKIIIEKIEELQKDVDGKIDNRKKVLDDKIKELEENVKGKKK